MVRQKKRIKTLSAIWEVDDELWEIIQNILDELDPPGDIVNSCVWEVF